VKRPIPIFESLAGWARADVIIDGLKKTAAPAKPACCKNDLLVVMMFLELKKPERKLRFDLLE
jgi:hypothetical protein